MGVSTDRFTDIPNEITLHIFAYLDLRGLIAVRGVSRTWRAFIPHTECSPIRKKVLSFYDTLIASPLFLRTRHGCSKTSNPHSILLQQYPFLPDEFRLWILDWPEKVVIGGPWAGMPRKRYQDE
ncbi:hypothetical protein M413DRAFT_442130 [Hebeloma cylindrosporum]|uniref:F-box domain-containing protein n=1 Tax=Hebeloma cylindrosporum TaxID=76867 RepID=A0A0C2YWT3_HEBCY|nr:hypothetical protein M413DRAFT_442130 [Hebeloma cylindrosporum h7]